MKGAVKVILVLSILPAIYLLGSGFSTYDYGHRCTKCLRDYHVVEKRYFGIVYRKNEALRFEGHDLQKLLGTPCAHVYRKAGFGESFGGLWASGIGCGITAEGSLFGNRWRSLKLAFELQQRFPESGLLERTALLVESILPSDATIEIHKRDRYSSELHSRQRSLATLRGKLESVATEEDWADALTEMEEQWKGRVQEAVTNELVEREPQRRHGSR
jgi:hypothetical protein